MFKKTMISAKHFAKKAITSNRMKTMGLMLLLGCGAAMAQNSAGDYTAGTTALSTVTEESGRNHFCKNIILVKYHIPKFKTRLK
jgi:hypothetical protein